MGAKFNPHEVLADKNNLVCTCPDAECEWHGNCQDCVALHRYMNTIPNCLEDKEDLYEKLRVGMKQIGEGKVIDADIVMAQLRDKYGFQG